MSARLHAKMWQPPHTQIRRAGLSSLSRSLFLLCSLALLLSLGLLALFLSLSSRNQAGAYTCTRGSKRPCLSSSSWSVAPNVVGSCAGCWSINAGCVTAFVCFDERLPERAWGGSVLGWRGWVTLREEAWLRERIKCGARRTWGTVGPASALIGRAACVAHKTPWIVVVTCLAIIASSAANLIGTPRIG